MNRINIDEYVKNSLIDFGKGVNTERQLVSVKDGLKPVYRRVIYTAMKYGNKMTKTAAISGTAMATVHPHSSDALNAVVSQLVRWGVFEGQGNHGMKMIYGDDIQPSASRYTEARIDSKWFNIFNDFMKYVPYKEAEVEGNVEPEYLPTPFPLILMFNGMGIGFGVNSRYPLFTTKSLYESLIYDNPQLLEAEGGLIIDKENSELDELWTKGLGKITYRYRVEKCGISSGYGTMISGSPEIFKPNLDKGFCEELAKGQVYILDQSSDKPMVFVGRSPNVRAISLDDIQNTCESLCSYTRTYRLTVADGDNVYVIPLREWLRETYYSYHKIIEKYLKDKIDSIKFDIEVYTWLYTVTQYLINNPKSSAEDLSTGTGCPLDVVKAIIRKSISTLMKTDSDSKLNQLKSDLNYYESIDPVNKISEMINEF